MGKLAAICVFLSLSGCFLLDQRPPGFAGNCLLAKILASAETGQSYICETPCDRHLEERLLKDFHEHGLSAKVADESNGVARIDAMTPQGRLFFIRLQPVGPDGSPVRDPQAAQTHSRATVVWLRALDRDDGLAELNRIYEWQVEAPGGGGTKK